MSHALERTSPKGGPFIGRCIKCGDEGFTPGDELCDCLADVFMSDEEALRQLIDPPQTMGAGTSAEVEALRVENDRLRHAYEEMYQIAIEHGFHDPADPANKESGMGRGFDG